MNNLSSKTIFVITLLLLTSLTSSTTNQPELENISKIDTNETQNITSTNFEQDSVSQNQIEYDFPNYDEEWNTII